MIILVEYTEGHTEKWRLRYVSRTEQAKIMTILPPCATYYHTNRSIKRVRTIDARKACDGIACAEG